MAIEGVMAQKISSQSMEIKNPVESFKDVLLKKREALAEDAIHGQSPTIENAVRDAIKNHEMVTKSVKNYLSHTNYSPQKLLEVQYKTSVYFLREQMFCKIAELSTNTFKNFTQMQI